MSLTRRVRWAVLFFALAPLLPCIFSQSGCSDGASKPSLVLGMMAPMTGAGARFGESQRNGVQLALNEINATGGIHGKLVRLILEDTKTEPPTAVTAFGRLAERRDVLAIFGSAASLDVPAYLPQVDRASIPHLLPVAVLPKITEMGSKWTFRSALNDKVAAAKMAEFVVRELRAKKLALIIEDSAFGETGLVFSKEAERLGTPALTVERCKRGDLDIRPQLTKIKSLGATHLQFWGYYAEFAIIAKQMRDLDYTAVLMGNQAPVNDKTIELGGAALEGALNVCLFVPSSSKPKVRRFVESYRKTFGADPDTWAAQSYDGMYLLAEAIRTAGESREAIRNALVTMKNFDGVTGTITFNPAGDAEFRETSIVKVAGGRYVPYRDD